MTGKSFSVWLNNEYIPDNPDKAWIKEVYSKAVKRSIEDGCTAFTRFFKHQSDFGLWDYGGFNTLHCDCVSRATVINGSGL